MFGIFVAALVFIVSRFCDIDVCANVKKMWGPPVWSQERQAMSGQLEFLIS